MRVEVSRLPVARPSVTPRHSPNLRPSRRTGTSTRPASSRVSDRTMVRPARPTRLQHPAPIPSAYSSTTMAKKTQPSHTRPSASSSQPSGLIVKSPPAPRSAKAKPALDDRSHRTGNLTSVASSCSASVVILRSQAHSGRPVGPRVAHRRPEPESPCRRSRGTVGA